MNLLRLAHCDDRLHNGSWLLFFTAALILLWQVRAQAAAAQTEPRPAAAGASHESPAAVESPIPPPSGMKYTEIINLVEKRIQSLRDGKRQREAELLEKRLLATKAAAQTGELPPSDSLELHAVVLYQGEAYDLDRFGATVRVTHTASPMILLLTAHYSVNWKLELAKGVQLKQVILGRGGERVGHTVEGLPDGVSLADYSGPGRPGLPPGRARGVTDSSGNGFEQFDAKLFELTGLHIQTVHSAREPVVIGPESKSWCRERAQVAVEELLELATREDREALWREIKQLSFPAIYLAEAAAPQQQRRNPFGNPKIPLFGAHTALGPIQTEIGLVPGVGGRTKVDPRGPIDYPFTMFSAETGEWTTVIAPQSDDIPKFSHVCAQAYDTKRDHWIIIGAGQNDHYMCSYDAKSDNPWQLIRPMQRIDCHALSYSREDDMYYAAVYGHEFQNGLAIYGFETDGVIAFREYIDGLQGRRGPDHRNWVNIYPVGRFLVVYVQRHADGRAGRDMNDGEIFSNVIDHTTGSLLCTLPVLPPTSPETQLALLAKSRSAEKKTAAPRLAPEPATKEDREERAGEDARRRQRARFVVPNKRTGHAYEVVTGAPVTWEKAREIAKEFRWRGRQGHLATITSAEEADFLHKQFAGASWIWLGGSNDDRKGVWRWSDGPESGQAFWERGKTLSMFSDWIVYSDRRKEQTKLADEPRESVEGTNHLAWSPGPSFREVDAYFREERDRGTWMAIEPTRALNGILIEYSMPIASQNP